MRGFISSLLVLFLSNLPELVIIAAIGGIAFAVSLIYLPAGIITGCVLIALAAIDYRRP